MAGESLVIAADWLWSQLLLGFWADPLEALLWTTRLPAFLRKARKLEMYVKCNTKVVWTKVKPSHACGLQVGLQLPLSSAPWQQGLINLEGATHRAARVGVVATTTSIAARESTASESWVTLIIHETTLGGSSMSWHGRAPVLQIILLWQALSWL